MGNGLFVDGLCCYESVLSLGGLYGEWIVCCCLYLICPMVWAVWGVYCLDGLYCYESVLGVGGLYAEWIVCRWFVLLWICP